MRWQSVLPLLLVGEVHANAGRATDGDLTGCLQGGCRNMHGQASAQGNALNAGGKADGGTYAPGESISLAIAGNGQYALAAFENGQLTERSDDNGVTITAPQSGQLALLGVRSGGSNQGVTYQTITLTAGAGGGGGGGGGAGGGGSYYTYDYGGPPSPPYQPGEQGGVAAGVGAAGRGSSAGTVIGVLFLIAVAVGGAYYYKKQRDEKANIPPPPDEGEAGYKAPGALPPNWQELQDPASGQAYFYNSATGESSWVRPA